VDARMRGCGLWSLIGYLFIGCLPSALWPDNARHAGSRDLRIRRPLSAVHRLLSDVRGLLRKMNVDKALRDVRIPDAVCGPRPAA
jgi:hypothetical protein